MLRWTLLVMALVFAQQSMAASENDYSLNMSAATDISQIIDAKYGDKCENFAGDGEVQKWGQIIEKEFDKNRHQALYNGPSDIIRYCNKYYNLNDEDRKGLWILIISAMTHYESTCIVAEKAKGPNGTAGGLLQLHRGKEANYSNDCRNGDADTAGRSIICGMSMLNDQVERGEPLFSRKSYWDVLRPQGESKKAVRIQAVIGQYPACKTGKSTDGTIPLNIQPDPVERSRKSPAKKSKAQTSNAPTKSAKKTRVASK